MSIRVVCPLCVQWRCAVCKSDEWPSCCDIPLPMSEPYWPDGTVATITQDAYCAPCQRAMDEYFAQGDET